MTAKLTLILGGARSGKSRRAEQIASAEGRPVLYIATCATDLADPEMAARIQTHRAQRPSYWTTSENNFDLPALFAKHAHQTVLLDCLTLWLSYHCEHLEESSLLSKLEGSLVFAREKFVSLIIVSNELGMGLVPSTPLGRSFRDLCGRANQMVARHADHVEFQIAGLPLLLKGGSAQ